MGRFRPSCFLPLNHSPEPILYTGQSGCAPRRLPMSQSSLYQRARPIVAGFFIVKAQTAIAAAPSHFCKEKDCSLPLEHLVTAGHMASPAVGCSRVSPWSLFPLGCPPYSSPAVAVAIPNLAPALTRRGFLCACAAIAAPHWPLVQFLMFIVATMLKCSGACGSGRLVSPILAARYPRGSGAPYFPRGP
jgi:hypothetical protein